MFKNISKSFWFTFVPGILLAITAIVLFSTNIIPLYYLIYTFIMWVLVCGLGIAVGYHRIFSHKTHIIPKWKENLILFFATFAGQGSSIFWVAMHRGYHHPYSDTEKDYHSPIHGKLYSFVGWWLTITEKNTQISMKYSVDLLRKPNHVFFHNHYLKIFWVVPLLILFIDWKFSFAAFWLVTGIALMQDNLVNVLGHTKGFIGYRNFETSDNSHNNIMLAYLTWGQAWHNNHHYDPKSYDFGRKISGKWWEFDPSLIFLKFIK